MKKHYVTRSVSRPEDLPELGRWINILVVPLIRQSPDGLPIALGRPFYVRGPVTMVRDADVQTYQVRIETNVPGEFL